jgi:enamine deaminase RidA (YjgF/YER057c/UK114 family)
MSANEIVNPETLAEPVGFAHAVVAGAGRTIYLGGQTAQGPDGAIVGDTMVEQFGVALGNVAEALRAAGGRPEHLVTMQIFVTDVAEYRDGLAEIGRSYRERCGRHYPAMALLEVKGLFDPKAKIELVAIASVPDGERR